jgi:arginase
MDISITNVHLDLGAGRRGTDMGPSAMHVAGLVPKLQGLGHTVSDVHSIDASAFESAEVGDPSARFLPAIRETCWRVAKRVEAAVNDGRFPLVLGGDHAQAIGTVAGIAQALKARGERLGVIWVDAHTDMNTPQSSPSGNIHGMPLAVLFGEGPPELIELIGGGPVLRPEDVCIIGARAVDAGEVALVRDMGVGVYPMSELDDRGSNVCVREAIERVSANTGGIHLSFDLDGVDPDYAPGVGTPVPGGLTLRESHHICELVSRSGKLIGMEMVELNPTLDVRNKTGELAVWLIQSALGKRIIG